MKARRAERVVAEMLSMYELTEFETCIHEAGHAVVAALCRINIFSISVVPDASSRARCNLESDSFIESLFKWDGKKFIERDFEPFETRKRRCQSRAIKTLHAKICVTIAGHKATEIARQTTYDFHSPFEPRSEYDEINEALAFATLLDGGPAEYTRLIQATDGLLRQHWTNVKTLAQQLSNLRFIEGDEVYRHLPDINLCRGIQI